MKDVKIDLKAIPVNSFNENKINFYFCLIQNLSMKCAKLSSSLSNWTRSGNCTTKVRAALNYTNKLCNDGPATCGQTFDGAKC
jgi:hypothetical protein